MILLAICYIVLFNCCKNTPILENTEIFLFEILENTEIFLLEILENTQIRLVALTFLLETSLPCSEFWNAYCILPFTLHLFAWNPDKHWDCGGEGWLPRLHHSSPPFTRCGKPLFLDASRNGLLCYVLAVFLLLEYDFLQQLFHNQTLICLQRYGFYRNLQEKLWFCSFWMNDFVKIDFLPLRVIERIS